MVLAENSTQKNTQETLETGKGKNAGKERMQNTVGTTNCIKNEQLKTRGFFINIHLYFTIFPDI